MHPILEVRGLSKRYRIGHQTGYLSFREELLSFFRPDPTTKELFWALRDVSFNVQSGQSLGIVGKNGAGKSTLLKLLSKITRPTEGTIVSRGRIASLLEVGTGFHQELTGRENVFFNGSLLGMKGREIKDRFDEIVDFSGVERFLDTPLKHYSSGMQLRLAFAVAAFLEPEILVIDEVLAVGDAEFQKKCLTKMEGVTKSGRTVLFVSHNLTAVENLCSQAILLNQGHLDMEGPTEEVLKRYQSVFRVENTNRYNSPAERKEEAYFKSIILTLLGGQPSYRLNLACEIASNHKHRDAFVAFDISNSIGVTIMQALPTIEPFIRYSEHGQVVNVEIDLPPLIPDRYSISAWIGTHNTETISWEKEVIAFEIDDSPTSGRTFPHSHNHGSLVPHSRIVHG